MQRSVVLVHGIFDTGLVFSRMARHLENWGFRCYIPTLRPSTGTKGLDELARDLAHYVRDHLPPDKTFDLIGFSMGGLVSRYYLQRLGGIKCVRRFITISAPHKGSILAYALANKGGRQMRPGSIFLKDLNWDIQSLEMVGIASIWTPFDFSILPAWNSKLPFGKEIKLPVVSHPLMIRDRRVLNAVVQLLNQ